MKKKIDFSDLIEDCDENIVVSLPSATIIISKEFLKVNSKATKQHRKEQGD